MNQRETLVSTGEFENRTSPLRELQITSATSVTLSNYPVSENLRGLADHPHLLLIMSWAVMGFELIFPLCLATRPTLIAALAVAATFHFANACLFGLNRFLWIWLSAYPSLLWFQERLFPLT